MPITSCPVCGREVSQEAASCPHCGHPLGGASKDAAHKTSLKRGSIVGLVGAVPFVILLALLLLGVFNEPDVASNTPDVSVSVESGTSSLIGSIGFIATALALIPFVLGVVLDKRLSRGGAVALSAVALAVSVVGFAGIVFYWGMLAICVGWLLFWEPILEVVGAAFMLTSALRR